MVQLKSNAFHAQNAFCYLSYTRQLGRISNHIDIDDQEVELTCWMRDAVVDCLCARLFRM